MSETQTSGSELEPLTKAGPTIVLAPTRDGIARAAAIVRAGGIVAFATETVYGIGCDATAPSAVAAIYAAKGRPSFNPLITHVPDIDAARRQGHFNSHALALAAAFWPGPLTLVVPPAAGASVCELARAGLATIALRVPNHIFARQFLHAADRPIAAPSANRSGHISPVTSAHVLEDLGGRINAILDCGPSRVGVESTIIACLDGPPVMLRPGGVSRTDIEAIVGRLDGSQCGKITAPGMLASHYAPHARLRLNATSLVADEGCLDFGGQFADYICSVRLDLSPAGDLAEAAANLYAFLRQIDATGASTIAVAPLPSTDIGEAITDRLHRAAAPRPDF